MRGLLRLLCCITVGGVVIAGPGCARIHVHRKSPSSTGRDSARGAGVVPAPTETRQESFTTIMFGIEPLSAPIDLSTRCPHGWDQLTTYSAGGQAALRALTLNIYSAWTAEMICLPEVTVAPKPLTTDSDD